MTLIIASSISLVRTSYVALLTAGVLADVGGTGELS